MLFPPLVSRDMRSCRDNKGGGGGKENRFEMGEIFLAGLGEIFTQVVGLASLRILFFWTVAAAVSKETRATVVKGEECGTGDT